MSDPADQRAVAQQWLHEAREELLLAHHIASDPTMPMRGAAFHAHLAAEKALKSLAFARGLALAKTHDLPQLLDRLPSELADLVDRRDLEQLDPWQSRGRYVGDLPDQPPLDVMELIAAAERVVAAATSQIDGDGA